MDIKLIRTEDDYAAALAAIEGGWGAKPGSAEADQLEVMALLVEQYEGRQHPVLPPDPIEAIRFRLDQMGLDSSTLEDLIEVGRGRVSEILNKRRALNLTMIRKLNERLQIPPSGDGVPAKIKSRPRSPATAPWWRPQRDSNPCYSLERAMPWAWLDDGDGSARAGDLKHIWLGGQLSGRRCFVVAALRLA